MQRARREQVAEILRARDVLLLEDDAYGMLAPEALPLAALVPERTYFAATLSKCIAPGLRVSFLLTPDQDSASVLATALRATVHMPAVPVWPRRALSQLARYAVGSTRYHHIEVEHRRLEIGVTWIGTAFQRTHINTEAKLQQLWYAFDVLKCRRVELKVEVDNQKSRTAILRLGAVQEGIFRKHMIYADGRSRDTSISRSSTTSGRKFARDSKTSSAILSRRHSRKRP